MTSSQQTTGAGAFRERFKELANRAQEAGKQFAAQVKDQQHRLIDNRGKNYAGTDEASNGAPSIDQQETETALKLVQYQNKALRDRLRSTAAENERLHEIIKEYRTGNVDGGLIADQQGEGSSEAHQSARQIQSLRETIQALEAALQKKESIHVAEINKISKEFEEKTRIMEENSKEKVSEIELKLQRAQGELDTLHSGSEEKIRSKEEELAHTSARCEILEAELSETKESLASETSVLKQQVDDLSRELAAAKQAAEQGDKEALSRLEEQIRGKKEELAQTSARCESLEAELSETKESLASEASVLKQQVDDLSRELAAAKQAAEEEASVINTCTKCVLMDDIVKEKESLGEEINSALRRAMAAEAESNVLKAEVQSIDRELNKQITALESTLSESRIKIQTLERDLSAKEDALNTEEVSLLEENVRKLESALTQERLRFETYSRTTEEKFKNLESILSTGSKAIEEVQRLKTMLAEAEIRLAEMEQKSEELPGISKEDNVPSYNSVMGSTMIDLEKKVKDLEAALDESERTHELRDQASQILKQEVEDLKRASKRNDVDVDYLKAVLVQSFACGELDSKSTMFDVIARLLHFSPREVEEAKKPSQGEATIFEMLPSLDSIKNLLPTSN